MPEQIRVDLEDITGTTVATTNLFTFLNLNMKISSKGDFQMSIPIENSFYSLRGDDYLYRVYYKYPEAGIDWVEIFTGIDKTTVDTMAENSRRTLTVYGPSLEEILHKEHIGYASASSGSSKSGRCTTVMYEFVQENVGSLATLANGRLWRGVNPISNAADSTSGPIWSGSKSYKNLMAVLQDIRQYSVDQGIEIDFRVNYLGNYQFEFQAGFIGVDRTATGLSSSTNGLNAAGNPPIIFAPNRGNLRRISVSNSRYSESNVVVALGPGIESSRLVGIAKDTSKSGVSPIAQRVSIVSGNDQSSVADLEIAAAARLDEMVSREKVSAFPRDGADILFRDFNLGDFVTVETFDGRRINRQIIEVSLRCKPSSGGLIVDKDVKLSNE
jgi:hypothetical protein